MITLNRDIDRYYLPKVSLMNIFCLKAAFDGSPLEADVWVQKEEDNISSVIARHGGRLYICSDGKNTAELAEFINIIGYGEIFTEKETAARLKLNTVREFGVLAKKCQKTAEPHFDTGLKAIYDGLLKGCDSDIQLPPFEDFAPDLSHRLRHGAATCVADKTGAAVAFLCDKGGIINGIAVDGVCRRQGVGSRMLSMLCSCINGDTFVCANEENTEFYIKNGFKTTDTAVIAR